MADKRPTPHETVTKLRLLEALMGQGMSSFDAIRQIGAFEHTYVNYNGTRIRSPAWVQKYSRSKQFIEAWSD